MIKICSLSVALFFSIASLIAQPTIQWQESLGGSLIDGVDQGNRISNNMIHTSDGGFIIAGHSFSNDVQVTGHHGSPNTSDSWVVKLDSSGNIEWQKSLGGTFDDIARGVAQTSDGGYIIIGDSYSNDGDVSNHFGSTSTTDIWIVKLDSVSNIEWERSYGGSANEQGAHIEELSDGYIFIGDTRSLDGDVSVNKGDFDFWVVKIDTVGNIVWEKSFGGSDVDRPDVIRSTNDGGYIGIGSTNSADGDVSNNQHPGVLFEIWVVKFDSICNIQWEQTYGGSSHEQGSDIIQTNDGGYILSGWAFSPDGDITCGFGGGDIWVAKLDTTGTIEWSECYGGSSYDRGKSVRQTTDNGFLLGGITASNDQNVSFNYGEEDCWIVKTDSIGNINWEKTYGGSSFEGLTVAVETSDGSYAFVGESTSNDGNVSGHHGAITLNDIWMVKLNPLSTGINNVTQNISSLSVFPNPVSSYTNISFSLLVNDHVTIDIYDIQGRMVGTLVSEKFGSGNHQISWDLNTVNNTAVENGIYFIRVTSNEASITKKVIVAN